MKISKIFLYMAATFTLACPMSMSAQDADTLSMLGMDEVVVTADRYASNRFQSTGAISVLKKHEIEQLAGIRSLGDILRQVPGFALLHLDGTGYDVQPIVRGFYGGGEAEYVLLIVDGQPINALETGLVNWNQIPLAAIESVEILRGGASSLYGDAAIGGVINIVTNSDTALRSEISVAGGSFHTFKTGGKVHMTLGNRKLSSYGNYESTRGYRAHANRTLGGLGAGIDLVHSDQAIITISGAIHTRNYEIPGPLTTKQIEQNRMQRSPFFKFDRLDEQTQRVALQSGVNLGDRSRLQASLVGSRRTVKGPQTLPLSIDFADVKWREISTSRIFASGLWTLSRLFADDQFTVGTDLQRGQLDATWYDMVTGTAQTFENADDAIGNLSATGNGARHALAVYMQYDIEPIPGLRASAGARYDRINDSYSPDQKAAHTALSPKFGVNFRYLSSTKHVGNWYANVAQSFKTPTLNQLFGQRSIPVPLLTEVVSDTLNGTTDPITLISEPTILISLSITNAELKPQKGTSLETGLYHRAVIIPGNLTGELSLSIYRMDMKDELDFEFETFKYGNIASSRHQGVELGVQLSRLNTATLRVNYTLQHVTYRAGENKGNFVKAVPRDYLSASIGIPILDKVHAITVVRSTSRIWLDDANTQRINNYSSVDFKINYKMGQIQVEFETVNLMNNFFSTTGFQDPGGSDTALLYPAAERMLQAGIRVSW